MIYVILALAVFDLAATIYDVTLTVRGIRKGVAVEGNPTVKFLSGTDKPGYGFLYTWNLAWVAGPLALGLLMPNPAVYGGVFALLFVDGTKHFMGGRKWRTLLNGGQLKQNHTIWEKLIGD